MRTQKTLKNILTSVVPYLFLTFLGFLRLKVMLTSLGEEIYALNQVFIQIFSYISLLEAGVGTLITQLYYKYFAKLNKDKICKIYSYSKKILKKISLIMVIFGLIVSFLLKYLTNNSLSTYYMQFVFILYLFRSVLEYVMYAPKFVIMADQKSYRINLITNVSKIIEMIIEVVLLMIYKNYILILVVTIVTRYISYYISNKIVFKEYPWLEEKETDEKLEIKEMGAVMTHKLAGTVYSNTDILLASSFLNPISVVIYSSYNYIVKFINDVVYMVGTSITASMGNVLYKDDIDKQYSVFEKINSLFLFFGMLFSISLYACTSSFVKLWIGSDKMMSNVSFLLMILTLFFSIVTRPFLIVRDSKALYSKTKLIAIAEAIINFVLSIFLVQKFEIFGLLLGTIIATLLTSVLFYPKYIYNNVFFTKEYRYFVKLILSTFLTISACLLINYLELDFGINYFTWFLYSLLYFIIIFILLVIFNCILNKNFKILLVDFKNMIKERFFNEKNNSNNNK